MTPQIVGTLLAAGAVPVIAYRVGRAQAAWRDVRDARRSARRNRRIAWAHTLRLAVGALVALISLTVAAYDLAR
ncbi:hypothetical protein [Actinoplanes palleronii]|uniref:Uncharacterized protein n=1 Tax=Actinoplanes palleronii TaxID=113570 RepID=A0ABQ4B4N8_9ACTN|nr:hypothetical protein [Actinoplanes palleronii]GIE65629.1 hypothetical protein Apa02nite_017370 [Actinoplanes palleronii]